MVRERQVLLLQQNNTGKGAVVQNPMWLLLSSQEVLAVLSLSWIYTLDPKNICFQRVSSQCLCGKVQEVFFIVQLV